MLLLGRAASILSGMCTGLDPDFNIWYNILPYAQEMLLDDKQNPWESVKTELISLEQKLIQLPGRLNKIFNRLERGEITARNPELNQRLDKLQQSLRSLAYAVIFSALLISGVQLHLAGSLTLSWVLFGAAGLALIAFLFHRG